MTSPHILVKGKGRMGRSQTEELIRKADGKTLSRTLSERDKLDILMDSSKDPDRKAISGTLASKLPNEEVLAALDKMNRWRKDKE